MSKADKIALIIPLLASDKDGEKLAALSALERLLKIDGYDWYKFAVLVRDALAKDDVPPWEESAAEWWMRERPRRPWEQNGYAGTRWKHENPRPRYKKPEYKSPPEPQTWREKAEDCLENKSFLSQKDTEFLNSILREWLGDLTEAQSSWLNDIYNRIF